MHNCDRSLWCEKTWRGELLTQIRADGRDFSELARRHLCHPSRFEGGLLGVVHRRQFPVAVADVLFGASAGDVVGPLATSQGFHLFLVEEHFPAELDEQTVAAIRQELFDSWLDKQLQGMALEFPLLEAL